MLHLYVHEDCSTRQFNSMEFVWFILSHLYCSTTSSPQLLWRKEETIYSSLIPSFNKHKIKFLISSWCLDVPGFISKSSRENENSFLLLRVHPIYWMNSKVSITGLVLILNSELKTSLKESDLLRVSRCFTEVHLYQQDFMYNKEVKPLSE